jgi:hypothetical protein
MISTDFAYWLSIHGEPSILPNQSKSVEHVLERLSEADLISVLYNGSDELALKALKILKFKFNDELEGLEEMVQHQSMGRENEGEYASDWN